MGTKLKKYLAAAVLLFTALIALYISHPDETIKEKKYPSEREFVQRTYPFYQYDPSAYSEAIKQTLVMKNELRSKYLSNGKIVTPWEFAGPTNIGGRVVDIEFNPQNPSIVYAAAATGGVFKSTDTGETWFPIFDDQAMLSIGDIAVDPINPSIIYVGTGEANGGHNNFPGAGLYKSTDAGTTWIHLGLDSTTSIGRIVINHQNPQIVYLAAVGSYFSPNPQRGIYKSTNGGETWTKSLFVSDSTGAIDIVMHPNNPNWLMAAMWERVRRPNSSRLYGPSSGIYRSTNGGNSWVHLDSGTGLPNSDSTNVGRIGLAISESQPELLYALYNDGSTYLGLYRTTNSGNTWINADPDMEISGGVSNFSWYFGQVRIHPSNPGIVYAMDVMFMRSSDAGQSWSQDWGTHVDYHALAFHPTNPDYQIVGNDGGISISTDASINWTDVDELPITQFYEIGLDVQNPLRLYGGTQDNNTVRTNTGNLNDWDYLLGGDGFYVIIDPLNSNIIYAEYQYGEIHKSTNGGSSFFPIQSGINSSEPRNWSTPVIMCPFNNRVLYYGTNRIYRTTNAGSSWTAVSNDLTLGPGNRLGTITTIAVSAIDSNLIFAGTDDARAWVSTNYGNSWTNISSGLPERWITRIIADPHDVNRVYITFSGLKWRDPQPHIFKSTNKGNSWINISGNLPDAPVNAFAVDNNNLGYLYAGLDIGAFVSSDDGTTWEVLGEGLPVVSVYDMKIHPGSNYLVAGTHGRSMYKINLSQVTGISENPAIASDYNLEQNYPNPFNPETHIKYNLPEAAFVELKVFDLSGSEIKSLVKEYKTPGEYNVSFNAEDLPSGVYMYSLSAGTYRMTRKMVLLK